jgi:hypothetical protein
VIGPRAELLAGTGDTVAARDEVQKAWAEDSTSTTRGRCAMRSTEDSIAGAVLQLSGVFGGVEVAE